MPPINETMVEQAALGWFLDLGYQLVYGPHIAPGEVSSERESFAEVVLVDRLRGAIQNLNPGIPGAYV